MEAFTSFYENFPRYFQSVFKAFWPRKKAFAKKAKARMIGDLDGPGPVFEDDDRFPFFGQSLDL